MPGQCHFIHLVHTLQLLIYFSIFTVYSQIPDSCAFSSITASYRIFFLRYLYGEKVEGAAYVVFGVERNGNKVRLPSMKQVNNVSNM